MHSNRAPTSYRPSKRTKPAIVYKSIAIKNLLLLLLAEDFSEAVILNML